jgi:hypothetical protein
MPPCTCAADCGARPGELGSPGCPWRPGNTDWPAEAWPFGPALTAVWASVPFLDEVDPGVLDGGPAEAAAITRRTQEARRLCLLCDRRQAVLALIVRPRWPRPSPARWADLCHPCYALVHAEAAEMPLR